METLQIQKDLQGGGEPFHWVVKNLSLKTG